MPMFSTAEDVNISYLHTFQKTYISIHITIKLPFITKTRTNKKVTFSYYSFKLNTIRIIERKMRKKGEGKEGVTGEEKCHKNSHSLWYCKERVSTSIKF